MTWNNEHLRVQIFAVCRQTGEPGFEPGLTGSEPAVLPLHHSPKVAFYAFNNYITYCFVVLTCRWIYA